MSRYIRSQSLLSNSVLIDCMLLTCRILSEILSSLYLCFVCCIHWLSHSSRYTKIIFCLLLDCQEVVVFIRCCSYNCHNMLQLYCTIAFEPIWLVTSRLLQRVYLLVFHFKPLDTTVLVCFCVECKCWHWRCSGIDLYVGTLHSALSSTLHQYPCSAAAAEVYELQ